jgi:hypothetical protein
MITTAFVKIWGETFPILNETKIYALIENTWEEVDNRNKVVEE